MNETCDGFVYKIFPNILEDKKEELETKLVEILNTTKRKYCDKGDRISFEKISFALLLELRENLSANGFQSSIVCSLNKILIRINIVQVPEEYAVDSSFFRSLTLGDDIK